MSLQAPVFFLFLDCVWQLSRQFPSAFEFSEYFLIRFYDMVLDCLYSNFLYDSTKHRLQASLHSRRSCFFGTGDDMPDMDDYEGPIFSAWGRWRDSLNEEESERCLNPLYYVFGIGETDCDSTASTPLSSQFSSILNDSNNLSDVGKFGLQEVADVGKFGLFSDREVTPVSVNSQDVDYYRHGLLVPETSMCSLSIWDAFFFRYLPELGACHQQLEVQQLESRMVRDVQKLKEELNELELSVGTFTTDLPTCIGEVVEAREKQIMDERRESVEVGMPLRPRLTASIYSYSEITEDDGGAEKNGDKEEIDGSIPATLVDDVTPVNSPHGTPTKNQKPKPQALNGNVSLPVRGAGGAAARQTSLAQFTDALYSSELEDSGGLRPKALAEAQASPVGPSRSPVTKTRLRVVKSQTSDPVVAAWQQNSPRQVIRHKELRIERNVETEKPPQVTSNTQLTQL